MNGWTQSALPERAWGDIVILDICGKFGLTAGLFNLENQQELAAHPNLHLKYLVKWTADWVSIGIAHHRKPTHFEVSDGSI